MLHPFSGVTRYTPVTLSVMMGVTRVTLIMSVTPIITLMGVTRYTHHYTQCNNECNVKIY